MRHSVPFLCFRALALISSVAVPAAVFALMGYLFWRALPVLGPELLFGSTPPLDAVLGRAPECGTASGRRVRGHVLAGGAHHGAWRCFPAVGCGVYLAEFASPRQKRVLGAAVDVLAGMPSIVMGLFGFMLILLLRRTVLPEANTSLLLAACCLSLLVLPVLAAFGRARRSRAVPPSLKLAAAASGFSHAQAVFHLFLPASARRRSGRRGARGGARRGRYRPSFSSPAWWPMRDCLPGFSASLKPCLSIFITFPPSIRISRSFCAVLARRRFCLSCPVCFWRRRVGWRGAFAERGRGGRSVSWTRCGMNPCWKLADSRCRSSIASCFAT